MEPEDKYNSRINSPMEAQLNAEAQMHTSSWIRFRLVHARPLFTALALGLTLIGIQGCGGPQKSAPESPNTTVQSPTSLGQVSGQVPSGAPIPKLTPVPGSVVGLVLGGGAPIANSIVTLWAASTGEPKQVGQTQTSADGRFELRLGGSSEKDSRVNLKKLLSTIGGQTPETK